MSLALAQYIPCQTTEIEIEESEFGLGRLQYKNRAQKARAELYDVSQVRQDLSGLLAANDHEHRAVKLSIRLANYMPIKFAKRLGQLALSNATSPFQSLSVEAHKSTLSQARLGTYVTGISRILWER